MPMTRWPMPAGAWGATFFFTTNADRIRRLTARRPIWSISASFPKPGRPDLNPAELHLKMRVSVQHPGASAVNGPNVKDLHAKIGQLAMENDFLAGALGRIPDASAK
jgi:hypothetical protein